MRSSSVHPLNKQLAQISEESDSDDEAEASKIEYKFERVRFTIPYMVYQRRGLWKFIDVLALNFHLLTATATIAFCIYW